MSAIVLYLYTCVVYMSVSVCVYVFSWCWNESWMTRITWPQCRASGRQINDVKTPHSSPTLTRDRLWSCLAKVKWRLPVHRRPTVCLLSPISPHIKSTTGKALRHRPCHRFHRHPLRVLQHWQCVRRQRLIYGSRTRIWTHDLRASCSVWSLLIHSASFV